MNDFFADLEAQLRAAHGRRPSRTARLGRPAAVAASLAAIAGIAVAVAIALGGGDARQAARPGTFTVPTRHVPAPSRAHAIALLNGTRTAGLGGRLAPSLLRAGFTIAAVDDDTRPADHTRVLFRPGALDTALAAAARLHVGRVEQLTDEHSPAGADVVVQLGPDAPRGATGLAAAGPTAVLRPPGRRGTAQGLATTTIDHANAVLLHFSSSNVGRGGYGVWLVELGRPPHFLGFTPETFRNGALEFEAPLTVDVHRPNTLLLTRESAQRPTRPGKVVLQGQLRFP